MQADTLVSSLPMESVVFCFSAVHQLLTEENHCLVENCKQKQ